MDSNLESKLLDEEEVEDDEEEEEEPEPRLAYSRMKNDINEILKSDSVSCIKANYKVVI